MYGVFVITGLSDEIWPYSGNTATLLVWPIFLDALVTVLTGFHCAVVERIWQKNNAIFP